MSVNLTAKNGSNNANQQPNNSNTDQNIADAVNNAYQDQEPNQYNDSQTTYADNQFAGGAYDTGSAAADILTQLSAFTASPIDIEVGNERTNKVLESLTGWLQHFEERGKVLLDIGLFEVDGGKHGLTYSSVVAYHIQRNQRNEAARVSYAVLLIESDKSIEPQQTQTADGRPLELPRGAFDAFNQRYDKAVINTLSNTLSKIGEPVSPSNFVFAGCAVLYKEVDISDTRKMQQLLSALASQAVSPMVTTTIQNNDSSQLTFVDVVRQGDYRLEASLQHKPNIVDINDTPILADLLIRTKAIENVQNRGGDDLNHSDVQVLAEIGIGIELEYMPLPEPAPQAPTYYGQQPQAAHMYNYVASLVITHVAQQGQLALDRLLLAISTSIIAHDPRLWMEMLRPKAMGQNGAPPLADFSAIGYDIPDEDGNLTPLPVNSEEYTRDNFSVLYQTIKSNVYPDQATCIDIPETVLGARPIKEFEKTGMVVSGQANSQQEQLQREQRIQAINDACTKVHRTLDQMTGNRFSELFGNGGAILLPHPIMIPMGYWIDSQGNKRDIREYNYLAARDYSGRRDDAGFMARWEDTFKAPPEYVVTACAERISLIREMAGNAEIVIKGYAWRYMIDPTFIVAAGQATVEAGVSPTYSNLTQQDQKTLRGSDSRLAKYLLPHEQATGYASSTIFARPQSNSRTRMSRKDRRW